MSDTWKIYKVLYTLAPLVVSASMVPTARAQFVQQGMKLVGGGAVGRAIQGASAAISSDGNTALLGGPYDDGNAGAAWVFTRANGVWSQQGSKLVGTGAVGTADQGISVSLSGDGNTAILGGASDNSGKGAAWIFTRAGAMWSQQNSKLVDDAVGVGGISQGRSVALSQDGNTPLLEDPVLTLAKEQCGCIPEQIMCGVSKVAGWSARARLEPKSFKVGLCRFRRTGIL